LPHAPNGQDLNAAVNQPMSEQQPTYLPFSPPFKRTITLHSERGQVVSRVSDNVHDFIVTISHDGARATDVVAQVVRYPWTTCPIGTARLKLLVGTPLASRARIQLDQSQQCTHMLDLAKLALAHALRGGDRHYSVAIEPTPDPAACLAQISRDGEKLFEWHVVNDTVVSPPPFAGHVTTGRADWAPVIEGEDDLREAALILRRSLIVFRGRRRVTPSTFRASTLKELSGVCISFQPEQVNDAVRPPNFVELR
jgi:hypothetical protein